MIEHYTLLASQFFNESSDPFTTPLLHPDGAFFALLCLFSWVLFLTLWAWNHKPQRRSDRNDRQRPRRREIPWDNWRN
jgi:hypothetical protein